MKGNMGTCAGEGEGEGTLGGRVFSGDSQGGWDIGKVVPSGLSH